MYTEDYIRGYGDGVNNFENEINTAIKEFNSGRTLKDILDIFNHISLYLFLEQEKLISMTNQNYAKPYLVVDNTKRRVD